MAKKLTRLAEHQNLDWRLRSSASVGNRWSLSDSVGIFDRPLDAKIRIVPDHADFVPRVVVGALVLEVGDFREHNEAVRVSRRNPELSLVVLRKDDTNPGAEGGREGSMSAATSKTSPRATHTSFPWGRYLSMQAP